MSKLDKIRSMNDDELIAFLRKYRNEKQTCKRCAKEVQIAIHTPARIAKRE